MMMTGCCLPERSTPGEALGKCEREIEHRSWRIQMNPKTKKTLVLIVLVTIVIGISGWLGDYTAQIMSTSTMVKNGMLVQLVFLTGLITGVAMCLALQVLDRRYSSQNPDEQLKNESGPAERS